MRAALCFVTLFMLTGCGWYQREITRFTGDLTTKCFKGVEYVQSDSGIAVAVDETGKPLRCGNEQ